MSLDKYLINSQQKHRHRWQITKHDRILFEGFVELYLLGTGEGCLYCLTVCCVLLGRMYSTIGPSVVCCWDGCIVLLGRLLCTVGTAVVYNWAVYCVLVDRFV